LSARVRDGLNSTQNPNLFVLWQEKSCANWARLGELLGLPETALDGRAIHIERTLRRAGRAPVYGKPKTRRGARAVLLPGEAVEAIRAALLWKRERRLALGAKYRDSGLLFVGPTGRPMNPSNLRNRDHVDRLTRLKLPRFRLHDLRHLQGTWLNAQRIDPRHIADRLGHSRASFTMDRYIHVDPRGQEQAAAIANELLMKPRVWDGEPKTR